MMRAIQDHPHIRFSSSCPFCSGPKMVGLIACWPCFRVHDLRNPDDDTDVVLENAEEDLRLAAACDLDIPGLSQRRALTAGRGDQK